MESLVSRESLALRYRPTSFDDLVGQKAVHVILRQMVARDRVPTALLFAGCRGTGKTTTARILAAALNCHTPPGPCGHCPSCKAVFDGTSLDMVEIDAASNGGVGEIRALRQQILYSVGGRCRVVVLDEAHSMSGPAFNALLKTLEEPPPGTVFILATTEPGRILDTVLSRCIAFHFGRIPIADLTARLAHIAAAEHLDVEPALLAVLAERADGAMRDAVMALDQLARAGITTLSAYADLVGDLDYGPALLAPVVAGDHAAVFAAADAVLMRTGDPHALAATLAATLRDLLILRSGGQLPQQGDALAARQALAERVDAATVVAALRVLWDLKTRVRADDPRAALDLALVMATEKFAPTAPSAPPTAPSARRLSLAEMATMRGE